MARECHRSAITTIHAYEDCSLWQFAEAKRLGKACVYDLPMCYYPAWEKARAELARKYPDWLSRNEFGASEHTRLERKRQEIELADLTLVPSRFAELTVREFYPYKEVALTPYGVDLDFWAPKPANRVSGPLRFIYAGQVSLRKGIPLLIEAWSYAGLRDAELQLIGPWLLAESKRTSLPPGITWLPPCSSQTLRDRYRGSEVFVFPTYADGFGLVLLEAMGCGLPVIASEASGGPEVITQRCGRVFPTGDLDRLIELFRWFERHRDEIPEMSRAARMRAERSTWSKYRSLVTRAVTKLV
jgi:starch synthase